MCNTGFCPNSLGNCTNTCPDGTTSTYLSPYCTCPEGQTFNEATNQCGCPAGSFATSGSGANLMCGVCPTNAWSDPASTSCGCPGRGIFSNFDGVGSCCPPGQSFSLTAMRFGKLASDYVKSYTQNRLHPILLSVD